MKTIEWTWKSSDGLDFYSQGWVPDGKVKAVVCLIHGLGEHTGRYAHVGAALTARGYALLGFDLRGHGKSGGQKGHTPSLEAYFSDIDLFLKEAENRFPGLPRFLYGHSLGGILILTYTPVRNPDIAGVIATAPGFKSALERQKFKILLAKILGSLMPTFTLASGLAPETISRDPEVVKSYVADPLVHNRVTASWGKSILSSFDIAYGNASKFPVPVLVMHGGKDTLGFPTGSQQFADLAPKDKCTLKIWEGLYHEIHNEPEKAEVFKFMLDWLDKPS